MNHVIYYTSSNSVFWGFCNFFQRFYFVPKECFVYQRSCPVDIPQSDKDTASPYIPTFQILHVQKHCSRGRMHGTIWYFPFLSTHRKFTSLLLSSTLSITHHCAFPSSVTLTNAVLLPSLQSSPAKLALQGTQTEKMIFRGKPCFHS